MRATVVVLDVTKSSVVVIERFKDDRHYHVFPGGRIECQESPKQAALRELSEELAMVVSEKAVLSETRLNDDWIFLIESGQSAEPIRIHGEEAKRATHTNRYLPKWVPISALADLEVFPEIEISWLFQQLKMVNKGDN